MDLKISQLPEVTGRTHDDLLAMVKDGVTSKINVDNFLTEPYIDGGNISGTVNVDVEDYHYFKFTLTGNVDVTLSNVKSGKSYLFWVKNNSNYDLNTFVVTGFDVYAVGGNIPDPTNNVWSLYQGYAVGSDFILYEIKNFQLVV